MKYFGFFLMLTCLMYAGYAYGQGNGGGYAYAFGSLGTFSDGGSTLTHMGGGFDKIVVKNLGLGAALGYMAPLQYMGEGIGVLDFNGSYYFTPDQSRWVPFVTGGYTLAFREGFANGMNFGGGVNYWWSKRTGLRLEFRDHFNPGYTSYHQFDFRAGILIH